MDAVTNVPPPVNEPIRTYAPGSAERAALEAKVKEPFNRFSDTLGHHEVELNFRYVIHVSLYRRLTYAGRPPIKVRIFQDRQEAAQWLNAPTALLMPDAAETS